MIDRVGITRLVKTLYIRFMSYLSKESLTNFFSKNVSLKLISVFVAIMLWIMVLSGQVITKSVLVPVNFIDTPTGYIALSSSSNLSVIIQGSKSLLDTFKYGTLSLNIDSKSLSHGANSKGIVPSDIIAPIGVEVLEITPSRINISYEQLESKNVRVTPIFIGEAPQGYKVISIAIEPEIVKISGVKSKLNSINHVETHQINLSDLDINNEKHTGLFLQDGVNTIVPNNIKVVAVLEPVLLLKTFTDVKLGCNNLKKGLKLKSKIIIKELNVTGYIDKLSDITSNDGFSIDCSDDKNIGKYVGEVIYINNVQEVILEDIDIDPKSVRYEIEDA